MICLEDYTCLAPYMHHEVVFIMWCLIFAISLEKAGLTRRLGNFIIKKAGNSVMRFTFIISMEHRQSYYTRRSL